MNTPTNLPDPEKGSLQDLTRPHPDRSDFVDFLHYMAATDCYQDTDGIISIVEKPWNYQDEYGQYLVDRDREARGI